MVWWRKVLYVHVFSFRLVVEFRLLVCMSSFVRSCCLYVSRVFLFVFLHGVREVVSCFVVSLRVHVSGYCVRLFLLYVCAC